MVGRCSHCCNLMNNRVDVSDLEVGARIRVGDNDLATIKYIGKVDGHAGLYIGVEWDNPERGKHNGTVDGVKYFETSYPTSGSMIRPGKIAEFENVRTAIECRYMFEAILDNELLKATQRQLKASLFEFVSDNRVQDKESHRKELTTVSLPNSNINSAGDLLPFANLLVLDLSASLIPTWNVLADIVKQLPKLEHLDLTRNRLRLPTEEEIIELEKYFRHLKNINLRRCNLRQWSNVMHIARLWPDIEQLSIAENSISFLQQPDTTQIFRNLKFLDLKGNPLNYFNEVVKLGNIKTLQTLYCIATHIETIQLPDCAWDEYLEIFPNLEELNLNDNHLINQAMIFNELDKLPSLSNLSITISDNIGYEETFTCAIGQIGKLTILNKKLINAGERRGAEYDIWKRYSVEWVRSKENNELRANLLKRCRVYPKLIEKYGQPDDIVSIAPKVSNFVTLKLINGNTHQATIKRISRNITVLTLQQLVAKLLGDQKSNQKAAVLKYVDNENNIVVDMDSLNKTLDYYSIQDGNSVIAEWK
ncbi:tubulin-specific chaperone E [Contarinia nasturtii]|uniref:tubulin-specific chaperone E n=1 Tax=Contarinia nasturtii TaxID=265458 RepID=UPI0012D44F24|nr:tubulin-specific chaperone E [Contarinia nasturtii]